MSSMLIHGTTAILAQIDKVSPTFLHESLLLLIGLLSGAAAIATVAGIFLKRRRTVEPQPLEVKAAAQLISADHCSIQHRQADAQFAQHTHQIQQIWARIDENQKAFELSAKARSAALYDQLDKVRRELKEDSASQRASTDTRIETLRDSIDAKIDAIPDRIVALLRNTGAIIRRPN